MQALPLHEDTFAQSQYALSSSPSPSVSAQDVLTSSSAPPSSTLRPPLLDIRPSSPLVSPTSPELRSPSPHAMYLSKEDAMHLVTQACAQSNVDVLEFLARCGLSKDVVSKCTLSLKDLACAQVLHERFSYSFTEDMLYTACLIYRTDLAAYMVALPGANAPSLSDREEAKRLLLNAARKYDVRLMAVIIKACEQVISQDDLIKSLAKELFNIIEIEGDADPMADLGGRVLLFKFVLQRGATIPNSFTQFVEDDGHSPQNERKRALMQTFLQSYVHYVEDVLTAEWTKLNLYSCSESFFSLDRQQHLVAVDLSHNCLTTLPPTLFDGTLLALEKVSLNDNNLSALYFDSVIDFSKSR